MTNMNQALIWISIKNIALLFLVFLLTGIMGIEVEGAPIPKLDFGESGIGVFTWSQTTGAGGGTVGDPSTGVWSGDSISSTSSTLLSGATSTTAYGINSISISGSTNYPVNNYSYAIAHSIWTDMITITGGTGTGTVTFGEQVHAIYSSQKTYFGADIYIDTGNPGYYGAGVGANCFSGCTGTVNELSQHISFDFDFTYGVPFQLIGSLYAEGGGWYAPNYMVDASHTAIFDTVILPEGATLSSLSGTSYPVQSNPVPEPSTMLLVGSGLVGLAGWGRRRFKK